MAISKYQPQLCNAYMCVAADTKPLNAGVGDKLLVTDTLTVWIFTNAGAWVQIGIYTTATAPPVLI